MIINTNNQSPDSVLTIAQTLTDTQKAQVRTNINSAQKFSPVTLVTASTTLAASHLEKTLVTNGASTNFVFTVPNATSLVVGYEVAILNYLSASTTIKFASGVKTLVKNKGILTASSFEVKPNEKIILKKITSDSWLWTGSGGGGGGSSEEFFLTLTASSWYQQTPVDEEYWYAYDVTPTDFDSTTQDVVVTAANAETYDWFLDNAYYEVAVTTTGFTIQAKEIPTVDLQIFYELKTRGES